MLNYVSAITINDFVGVLRGRLRILTVDSEPRDIMFAVQKALLNGWEVVLSWRDEANTASLQSAFQETHHHQEIPTSDT